MCLLFHLNRYKTLSLFNLLGVSGRTRLRRTSCKVQNGEKVYKCRTDNYVPNGEARV